MNHRLEVPEAVSKQDIEALVLNRYPRTEVLPDGQLQVTRHSRLTPEAEGVWSIQTLHERAESEEDRAAAEAARPGLVRAFPDAVPHQEEGRILDLVHAIARRTGGKVVTDSGVELEPHLYSVPDLHIVAADLLTAEETLELLKNMAPEAEAITEGDGYATEIKISKTGVVKLSVTPGTDVPSALLPVEWVRDGFVCYDIVFQPEVENELLVADPEPTAVHVWREAYYACAAIAKALNEELNGFILDGDGFLVDQADLI